MAALTLTLAGSAAGGAAAGAIGRGIGGVLGAFLGGMIDRRIFGSADEDEGEEGARVSDISVSGGTYGGALPAVWGRWRVPGNVIWMRGIREEKIILGEGAGGGKGSVILDVASSATASEGETVTTYHYYADIAIGLCEGELTSIYRIFCDRLPIDPEHVGAIRLYYGSEDQQRDPLIEAEEGTTRTPAFRGLAYIVLENFYLTPYGNRVPQFEVEVYKGTPPAVGDARHKVESLCLIPASGEWAYDPQIVRRAGYVDLFQSPLPGFSAALNSHSGQKKADFTVAIENLGREIPNCDYVNLVYAWFGTSIDVATCELRPECEYGTYEHAPDETEPELWSVAGKGRPVYDKDGQQINYGSAWPLVSSFLNPDGSTGLYYGGTISDASVIRAIQHLKANGIKVLFYPFILMDVPPPDPEPFPWRGRITGDAAGVATFFERAEGYLRFIDHCLDLCQLAGGVDTFAVGSEMVALNRIRDGSGVYPAIAYWKQIATDAKTRLGSGCNITYAADWSEYRYNDRGGGNVDFPLDELWGDPNIDVVGIDAYFPLTDTPAAVHDKEIIKAGWNSGELIDYYYASLADRDLARRGYQPVRTPIDDQFYAIKNIQYWWETAHTPRVNGVPQGPQTAWVPESKPIWFTEYGFPSVNCAANQPNVFIDPKSAESFAPYYSNFAVDRQAQRAGVAGTEEFWDDAANNPASSVYSGPMLDRRFLWTWDARPYPFFPTLRSVWADGENFRLGHWIQGKIGNMQLGEIVRDLCNRAGLTDSQIDVTLLTREVVGYVAAERRSVRDLLSILQVAFFFDAAERNGVLHFFPRGGGSAATVDPADLGAAEEGNEEQALIRTDRTQNSELPVAIDVVHLDEGRDYQTSSVSVRKQLGGVEGMTTLSLPLIISHEDAQAIGQRALREIWQGRESFEFNLPARHLSIDAGDLIDLPADGVTRRIRIEKVSYGAPGLMLMKGVAADGPIPDFYTAPTTGGALPPATAEPLAPIRPELLDMPLMTDAHEGSEESFYFASCPVGTGRDRGAILYQPTADGLDYTAAAVASAPSVIGDTSSALAPGPAGVWDRGNSVEVVLSYGTLESAAESLVLAGANAALLGNEVIQFATATLVAAGRYLLSDLLRGQLGTEHEIATHAIGTRFVLLSAARQVRPAFSLSQIGAAIAFRAAPNPQTANGALSSDETFTNSGRGLRPYSPAHPKAVRPAGSNDIDLSWIRRTRIGGDSWLAEVPLGEETEEYDLLIHNGGTEVRQARLTTPAFAYTEAMQIADFGAAVSQVDFSVFQISRVYGRGTEKRVLQNV